MLVKRPYGLFSSASSAFVSLNFKLSMFVKQQSLLTVEVFRSLLELVDF